MVQNYIIKRRGRKEEYDERKVYASVYSASLNAHLNKLEAEKIAAGVSRQITTWLSGKGGASSEEIFKKTAELLKKENPDAAFMYETHRDLA